MLLSAVAQLLERYYWESKASELHLIFHGAVRGWPPGVTLSIQSLSSLPSTFSFQLS